MAKTNSIGNRVNNEILKYCREQMALSVEEAQKKASIKKLNEIEEGKQPPTLKQLERLPAIKAFHFLLGEKSWKIKEFLFLSPVLFLVGRRLNLFLFEA